jgi:beta-N-acetylhexosaminidase
LPIINHSKEEIQTIDLPPFRSAIRSGVDVIMTAHIVVPALDDSGRPATLSKPILTGVLREELGHEGVVITDALDMDALQQFGQDRVPVEAIEAGADVLLMPPNMDVAYNAVLDAVRSDEIPEKRIDESVYRILELKQEQGLFENPYVDEGAIDSAVGTPQVLAPKAALICKMLSDVPLISTIPGILSYFWCKATLQHEDVTKVMTDETITLVKNDGGTLPLQANSDEKALVTGHGGTPSGANAVEDLAEDMSKRGVGTDSFETGATPDDATITETVSRAEGSDLIVVVTGWAWALEQQQKLVQALLGTGKPVVVAAVADPYDIAYFPEAKTYLTTYGFRAVSMEALARVLFGEVKPSGKLPVSLPAANDPENTLYPYGYGLSY